MKKTQSPWIPLEFIRLIPKTDLHLHLDGSLRLPTLIELARQEHVKMPSFESDGLKELVFKEKYADLREYLRGFQFTCAVMRNPENIERIACELAEDNIAEGVRYVEVRFAPQLHVHNGLTMEAIVRAAAGGLDRARRAHNATRAVQRGQDLPFEFGIIVCAMRAFNARMGDYYRKLQSVMSSAPRQEVLAVASLEMARHAVALRDRCGLPIVGFDLAGEEAGYPAAYHVQAYQFAHDHFLKKTVHASEAYGPESIFQAITNCHANRIGHGTFLFEQDMLQDKSIENPSRFVEQLVEYIASERITVEVCPTSNLQTSPQIRRMQDHPLQHMLEHNLSITICTDNRLVSNTTVTRELELVAKSLRLTRRDFRNLIIAGFKGSFFGSSYSEKRRFVRSAIERYDRLAARWLDPGDSAPDEVG